MLRNNKIVPVLVMTAVFISCSRSSVFIQREDLASFDIGIFENELDLFEMESRVGMKKTELVMRDGQFYISNGEGRKVARYNSYGDLIFMIYNEETNPRLLSLKQKTEGLKETRWANAWVLRDPSYIAVNSRKDILVIDKLPPERHGVDSSEMAVLDNIVLMFDGSGEFIKYIGQEGPGGTPFACIEGIWITQNDKIVVASRFPNGIKIYSYDSGGNHVSTLVFDNENMPVPVIKQGVITMFESVAVAPDSSIVYLKINYYRKVYDTMINMITGIELDSSFLWLFDTENGMYIRNIEIPFYENVVVNNGKSTSENIVYSMFGVAGDNKVFLYVPIEEGYSILILSANGSGEEQRGVIKIDPSELEFIAFNVSVNGILSALLASDFNVKLVWWRTDKFVNKM